MRALLFPITTSLLNCSAPSLRFSPNLSRPEQAVQANLEERTAEAEKLGLEKGLKKGLEKGLVKGKRTMLKALLIHKYGIDDDWVDTLSEQQLDDVVVQILDCATYDALKEKMEKNKSE